MEIICHRCNKQITEEQTRLPIFLEDGTYFWYHIDCYIALKSEEDTAKKDLASTRTLH